MKKFGTMILIAVGFTALLASCQCKTCRKDGEPSYQFCKDGGTEEEYNNQIDAAVFAGFECK